MKKNKDKLVEETLNDFQQRVKARKNFDNQWQLNMNFYMGNQYCDVGYGGFVREVERQYFWQEREVYNHIAPTVDVRLAKLSTIKPKMKIVPATNEERDIYTAKVGKKILDSTAQKMDLTAKISQATKWSEICGSCFYKISWNPELGQVLALESDGKKIKSGEVEISVCSPFEIYPDSVTHENIQDCDSLIHAKAYSVEDIRRMYGVEVDGKDINIYSLDGVSSTLGGLGIGGLSSKLGETVRHDSAIVIEKYVKPNVDYPDGRLIIIAGDKLVFDGDLPYVNGIDGKREFPFVRQICQEQVGSFWGVSLVERAIPVQRAYNAVKNRKQEYLNRLTMGVLTVEDGSVDVDNLEEEGLAPGKVLIYRQGASTPKFLEGESLPGDLEKEEEVLLTEIAELSGTAGISKFDTAFSGMSGVALEILQNESEARLKVTTDSIKSAIQTMGKHILRLYKQFATMPRLLKIVGENGNLDVTYFRGSDISSDDVQLDTEQESRDTLSQRREMIFTLLDKGLLQDENGKISNTLKSKILDSIGFGTWEGVMTDLSELHIKNADSENQRLLSGQEIEVKEIDDHNIHLNQHVAFMLKEIYSNSNFDKQIEQNFLKHIDLHKKAKGEE